MIKQNAIIIDVGIIRDPVQIIVGIMILKIFKTKASYITQFQVGRSNDCYNINGKYN